MILSLSSNSRHRFQGMEYSRYPVQSPNISNEWTLGVEESVLNVVNSHYVIDMNAFNMLWSGMDNIV